MDDLATQIGAFAEDAEAGPWRPEARRRRAGYILLTNDAGDSLRIDEKTAAMLVEAIRLTDVAMADEQRAYAAAIIDAADTAIAVLDRALEIVGSDIPEHPDGGGHVRLPTGAELSAALAQVRLLDLLPT